MRSEPQNWHARCPLGASVMELSYQSLKIYHQVREAVSEQWWSVLLAGVTLRFVMLGSADESVLASHRRSEGLRWGRGASSSSSTNTCWNKGEYGAACCWVRWPATRLDLPPSLSCSSYVATALALDQETNGYLRKYEACDNVDLEVVLCEYESYHYYKHHKYPKFIRKAEGTGECSTEATSPPLHQEFIFMWDEATFHWSILFVCVKMKTDTREVEERGGESLPPVGRPLRGCKH